MKSTCHQPGCKRCRLHNSSLAELMWAHVTMHLHSRHHLLQMAKKLPVERGRACHQKYNMAISSPNSNANFFALVQLKWSVEGLLTGLQTSSSTHKKVFGQQTEPSSCSFTGRREPISEAPYGTVVGMAGVASLSSRSLGQDPILTPWCGRSSYWTCQTRTTYLAELHWEIARKTWTTFQRNYARGTLAHTTAEGMHAGLVQLVQSAKDLQKLQRYHCELCEIRLPPEYQAASCGENEFLVWPRRFMPLLEMHL